jgi:hypothetical protein
MRQFVFLPTGLAIAGLTFLALAMTGVVLLVTDFIFGTPATTIATAMTALLFALLWYILPLRRRLKLQAAAHR